MNINKTAVTLGAAILVAAAPAVASAASVVALATPSQASPISIDNVQISQAFGFRDNFNFPGQVSVAFRNDAAVPATKVVFVLQSGSDVLDRFTEVGNYAHGVTVRQNFVEGAIDLDEQLAVESVSFADGSTWQNPAIVLSRRQSQAAPVSNGPAPMTAEQIRETGPTQI
jgi:hypothetical protein